MIAVMTTLSSQIISSLLEQLRISLDLAAMEVMASNATERQKHDIMQSLKSAQSMTRTIEAGQH